MRMVDSCFGIVNNAPAGAQNALSDSHVFEYFQFFGEPRGLPNLSPDGRIGVREMVIPMAEASSVHRHLDDSCSAVHHGEGRTPLQPGFCLRQLAPVNCPDRWFVEVAQECGQPYVRCWYRVLREKY